jgi:MOSC domain-containing protein YiiM
MTKTKTMTIKVQHVYIGKDEVFIDAKGKAYHSSYKKNPLESAFYEVDQHGFKLDNQSDLENHGGVDKAICVFSLKDYDYLKEKFDLDLPSCAFGENLSIVDVNDQEICLGDRFTYGDLIVEVSQPRQPCWKVSSVLGIKNLTSLLVKEHKTGFYLRVLQTGKITPNDRLELISREYPKFTIEYINKIAFNTKENQENIQELLKCDKLSKRYRSSLEQRYQAKEVGLQVWQRDV